MTATLPSPSVELPLSPSISASSANFSAKPTSATLLDPIAIAEVEAQLQLLGENQRIRSADGLHDLLLRLGDLSRDEIAQRVALS